MLAWAGAGVGAICIASALTPELASRSDLVRGVLPPGVPAAARVGALAFGFALLWLARSLARRRHRAWQLAVGVVVASAVAHLAKGLDVEEALASLALLAALVRHRRRFDVPGDPEVLRPLLAIVLAAGAGAAVVLGAELHHRELPEGLVDTFLAVGLILGFAALHLWLRPLSQAVAQTVGQRRLARSLVRSHGGDSLAFFALRRDKTYFFSPTRRSFLAYRVVAGCALVSGDPVGDQAEAEELLAEFRRVAHAHGWRLAILGASRPWLGLRSLSIGDEAVLRPAAFSLEGRAIRKVRQSVTRLTKAGYTFRVVPAERSDREQLDAISREWLGDAPERGFSMAIDDLYVEDTVLALAEDAAGAAAGFLHLVPSSAGWSLSTMRRRGDAPNGLMEFLIVETLAWARETGAEELSLNFCALADFVAPERAITTGRRLLRRALQAGDRVWQLERLYAFNRKFFPEWRPRYLCVEKLGDLPVVGLAYLRVEQLIPTLRR